MKQIKIGTCVPGAKAEEWLKGFIGKGFETFSLNFHMSLEGTDLDKLALSTEKLLAGTDSKITTIGYYCNPIQYAEHRKTLENVICIAGRCFPLAIPPQPTIPALNFLMVFPPYLHFSVLYNIFLQISFTEN